MSNNKPTICSTHYHWGTMDGGYNSGFSQWAVDEVIIKECAKKDKLPVLFYCGMSGVSLATGIATELHYTSEAPAMIYVRKKDDKHHHGNPIEVCYNPNTYPPLYNEGWNKKDGYTGIDFKNIDTDKLLFFFVDDLIESGNTFKHCLKQLKDFNLSPANTQIILYDRRANCKAFSIKEKEDYNFKKTFNGKNYKVHGK